MQEEELRSKLNTISGVLQSQGYLSTSHVGTLEQRDLFYVLIEKDKDDKVKEYYEQYKQEIIDNTNNINSLIDSEYIGRERAQFKEVLNIFLKG